MSDMNYEEQYATYTSIRARLEPYYNELESHIWMLAPQFLLGGMTALECIRLGKSDDVVAIIDRLDSGAYL